MYFFTHRVVVKIQQMSQKVNYVVRKKLQQGIKKITTSKNAETVENTEFLLFFAFRPSYLTIRSVYARLSPH